MANKPTLVNVPGSNRVLMAGAHTLGPTHPEQTVEVTVLLRRTQASIALAAQNDDATQLPKNRRYLTREEFAQQHGADANDIAAIKSFAQQNQLVVVKCQPAQRSIVLSGSVSAVSAAFGTTLHDYEYPNGTYRGRTGHVSLPRDIVDIVQGVFGLDDRPQAVAHFRIYKPDEQADAQVNNAKASQSTDASFTPVQLGKLYNFPTDVDGTGQCIGLIELGGGTRPADIAAYFASLGIAAPKVKIVSVDHAKNGPTTSSSADGEVMLDVEVAGGIAPKATVVVYFAPNTDKGFLDAVTTAVHDQVNKPSVISISWGSAEANWTAQAMDSFEQVFSDATTMGITICCAAGDNGSADGETDNKPHVDFPASAPHALACGGTKLVVSAGGSIQETVWNEGANSATGGGFSSHFSVPDYQTAMGKSWSGRGLPDVAGDADPASGYVVRVDGQQMVIGGTSAVAPLWAGLIALMNQKLGKPVGYLQPLLYGKLQGLGVTNDITDGNNGVQQAGVGWDACTGWGTPNGQKLLQALNG